MDKYASATSIIMMVFGIIFLIFSADLAFSIAQVYAIASTLLLIGGGLVLVNSLKSRKSLFVCGECHLTFLEESDLRKHYAIEHIKKDSEEKKG